MIIKSENREKLFNGIIALKYDIQHIAGLFQNEIDITSDMIITWDIRIKELQSKIDSLQNVAHMVINGF